MEVDIKKLAESIFLITLVLVGGGIYSWKYDRDFNTFYNNGTIEARSNWEVHMNRVYFNIKYSYQRDNCLRDGGRLTATRCYYPDNFYLKLSRKLAMIDLNEIKFNNYSIFSRSTSYNKYGTSGTTAGTLTEKMIHDYNVTDIENFPQKYIVEYKPKDTTKYKLALKVDLLKDMNLPIGNYTDSEYIFGNIKITVPEEYFDYTEVIDYNTIKIWFLPQAGDQVFDIELVDPLPTDKIIVKPVVWNYIYKTYNRTVIDKQTEICTPVVDAKNVSHTEDCTIKTTYKIEEYQVKVDNTVLFEDKEYTNSNVNEKEGYIYICNVPVGDRNWPEFPMREYEIEKGVCRKVNLRWI